MNFWGDYHTHTVFSHGKGSVEDNVIVAKSNGLKEIAITDHGICGFPKNLQPSDLPLFKAEIERCRLKHPDIRILCGVEANLISSEGMIDMPDGAENMFDVIVCGFHAVRVPDNPKQVFKLWMPNLFPSKSRTKRKVKNTDAYIKAMQNNRVGVIAHPMRQFPCDLNALGEVAGELGVYLELNSKSNSLCHSDLEILGKTNCEFICSSDAHSPDRVGDFSAVKVFDEVFTTRERIANFNRKPIFR